jgi:dCMP deaminase
MAVNKWDRHFMSLAKLSASMSKDPSTKVGSSIKGPDKRVLSLGYNGFPSDMSDDPELLLNREYKYKHIIHAEDNAIRFALRSGSIPDGSVIYTTLPPCYTCYKLIIASGIRKIVTVKPSEDTLKRWSEEWSKVQHDAVLDNCEISYLDE